MARSTSDLRAEVKDLLAKAQSADDPGEASRHRERASMLALTIGTRTGRLYEKQVPYNIPSD